MSEYRSIQSFLENKYGVFQEADEDNKKTNDEVEEFDDDEETDSNDTDNKPEDETSDNVGDDDDLDLSDFGNHGGDDLPNNEYDPKEVETLNALIASEAAAMSEYMDAAKTSHVDVLQRLYSDIGDEERFHMEQLIFAKSELTGEEYIPRDKDVKKEYEELLALGMDEESAMATAVDKVGVRVKVEEGDDDDITEEQLEKDMETLEAAVFNTELLMMVLENGDGEDIDPVLMDRIQVFTEQFYVQEEVMNAQELPKKYTLPTNPFKLLRKLIEGALNLVATLIRHFKAWVAKSKFKMDRMRQWIEKNHIEGLFAKGVWLYLWNDAAGQFDFEDMAYYVNILVFLARYCASSAQLKEQYWRDLMPFDRYYPFRTKKPGYDMSHMTPELAMNRISGLMMSKTKIVITENNEETIKKALFGFTENIQNTRFSPQAKDETLFTSDNFYYKLDYLSRATQFYLEATKHVIEGYQVIEGDGASIYHTNRNMYNKNYKYLKAVIKGFTLITRCLTHDLKALMNLGAEEIQDTESKDRANQTRPQNVNPWDQMAKNNRLFNSENNQQQN
jgi:hypothetical protein